MYTVNPLLTPPEDCYSPGAQQQRQQQQQQDMSYMGTNDVTSPSEAYSKMTLAEKVREANQALVYTWGKMLVGMGVSELCENAALLRNIQLISLDDLPKNFCISPVDEFICPSDDAARVIVIVSDAGIVVDTGMYDMDGSIFYRGFVVNNQYLPTSASKRTFTPD
ncbi:hypothetical protein BX661DRAFT_168708 [Kickxella alabastrina]|uniref:uncharacterized protein n=1 Tax=Kickxella alabastrina TaxID=61397 RepID=UPI0022205F7C|nr:uncharacterized protein BX661DRAFT_168708 [Kickxella alabastrina]KAI7834354.1 hypothetical protein BX661DRAFT_168708 [Kickxella alabastrina]